MSAPSSMSSRRTFWPSGPVWCVTRFMPSIDDASFSTSSIDRASLTPPPLPRPPAWTCAFTTHTGPPSCFAALTASGTENAGSERETRMPYLRNTSLPWYSWIFIVAPARRAQSRCAAIPLRIVAAHDVALRIERMAAVELERLELAFVLPLPQPGEHLHGGRRQVAQQLGQVRASFHAAERLVKRLPEALHQVRTDELPIRVLDALAPGWIGNRIHPRLDVDDRHRLVDREAHPHVVHGLARPSRPAEQHDVVILDVGEMRLDVEQAVVAREALVARRAVVKSLARYGGGQRHANLGGEWRRLTSAPSAARAHRRRASPARRAATMPQSHDSRGRCAIAATRA